MNEKRSIVKSFLIAWNGIWTVLIKEPAFKHFILIAVLVIGAMLYFPTTRTEKGILLTMIFAVLTLELINTALERFLDFLQPKYDERVKLIKDLLSAIVLLVVLGAATVGILIFWPHIKNLFL